MGWSHTHPAAPRSSCQCNPHGTDSGVCFPHWGNDRSAGTTGPLWFLKQKLNQVIETHFPSALVDQPGMNTARGSALKMWKWKTEEWLFKLQWVKNHSRLLNGVTALSHLDQSPASTRHKLFAQLPYFTTGRQICISEVLMLQYKGSMYLECLQKYCSLITFDNKSAHLDFLQLKAAWHCAWVTCPGSHLSGRNSLKNPNLLHMQQLKYEIITEV